MGVTRKVSVVGLGYVGLPVAVAFGKKGRTIGFDINETRVGELNESIDHTLEVETKDLKAADCLFTTCTDTLAEADFHIVAVPTPINNAKQPDLSPLIGASKSVGKALKKGDIVVYESTVYPGATEEECVPVLEKVSGLKCGKDFFVGYSPERINPGDKEHTFATIKKVVSGQNPEILEIVAQTYESVVTAGVFRAASIKAAEAAKVIENTQRDLNIALINELSTIFNKMGICTHDVLAAAGTKWNFLPFKPGLVGGHCIGVDPYYLTHKALRLGIHPEVILAGRRINDDMGKHIAQQTVKEMIRLNKPVRHSKVALLGLTFKENCPDLRNTKVIDIIEELESYGVDVVVHDPMAAPAEAKRAYNIDLKELDEIKGVQAVILAVPHHQYKEVNPKRYTQMISGEPLVIDIKNLLDDETAKKHKLQVWKL